MKDISHEFEKEYENVLSKIHRFEINCKKKKKKNHGYKSMSTN